jgi:hypothetical protein
MIKKIVLVKFLLLAVCALTAFGQEKTVVNDAKARAALVGRHKLSLQWISWDYFGTASVINRNGVLRLKGEQKSRKSSDFVKIDGVIVSIDEKEFVFDGTIVTQIDHINNGEPCERAGEMTFRITGKRRYWRLQEMDNPCDGVTDYVDIYFR